MDTFEFVSPTKIYFGKGQEERIGEILKIYGFCNVLLVIGGGSARKSGLLAKIEEKLNSAQVHYFLLEGIKANPDISSVKEGLEIIKSKPIDCVVAIGGGSVIDVAKLIAVSYFYDGDPYDFNLHKAKAEKALPVGCVLTLSAAGSELSNSCVISNRATKQKQGFNSDLIRPLFAIENPKLTFTVNSYQTACGIVDIFSHSFERYFAPSVENEFSDSLALGIMKNVLIHGKQCLYNPMDYEARKQMMLDSSISHNGITSLGKETPFLIHPLEHVLSGVNPNIAHGAGLAPLTIAWMKLVYKYDLDKFAQFSRTVFNINTDNKEKTALLGINALENLFKEIGMPIRLSEFGFSNEDIETLANLMTLNGTRMVGPKSIKPIDKNELINLLELAF